MSGPVLVTGAGGFIGRAVVERLAEAGIQVRAGLRRMRADPRSGVEAAACDLGRPDEVKAACAGAAAIVHAAGREPASMAAHLGILLDAAGRAGVERIVLFSSTAVYGGRTGSVAEDDISGALDAYGTAKRDCETMARAWVSDGSGRRVAVLRPGIVYGRGSDLWIERPAAALRAGALTDLGAGGEGIAALIHVADVAEATRAALDVLVESGPAAFATNLVGSDTPTWNAYFAALAERLGLAPPPAPGPIARAARRALAPPAKAFARLGVPVPDVLRLAPAPGERRLFARAARYETERAATTLGFRPAIGLEAGLAESMPWPIRAVGYARPDGIDSAPAKAASAANAPAAR